MSIIHCSPHAATRRSLLSYNKMPKYLQIQINSPCHENWDKMQPTASGNFCSACQKTVIDFTTLTDNQLLEYFKKRPADTCGRFYTDQLEQPLELPEKRIPWMKYFLTVSLPALLFTYKGQAQRFIKRQVQPMEVTSKKSHATAHIINGFTITGKVTGENGQPVPFASVIVPGSSNGIAADSNGVFTIRLRATDNTLEVSAVGYKQQQVMVTGSYADVQLQVALIENVTLNAITCTSSRRFTMGAYSTRVTVRTITNKMTAFTTPVETLEVFPNPAKRYGQLTIRFKKPVSNNQLLTIYNAAGNKMQQQFIPAKQPIQQANLDLRLAAAGYYFISIIDEKTQEKQSVKFVVE